MVDETPAEAPASGGRSGRDAWWRRNFAIPVLLVAMGVRIYNRVSTVSSETLSVGERPRADDVLVASVPGSSEALAAVLEVAASIGSGKIPSLELGSTRRKFASRSFDSMTSGFWLDPEMAKQLETARVAVQGDAPVGVDLRLFTSWQPLDASYEATPSTIAKDFECPPEMAPYACLCVNCPVRWDTIVYVVERRELAGCRTYGMDWAAHVASYARAADAAVGLYDKATDSVVPVQAVEAPRRQILLVKDDDVRMAPGKVAVAVYAWILDVKTAAKPRIESRYFTVDAKTMRRRVEDRLGSSLGPSTMARANCSDIPTLGGDLAAALGLLS
eukprot:CAMPEP_0197429474 /NCGR_PEP_ID=MMETSP1170-20131217/43981_1 /TAXON_ID=54406 /ORGANISM="Sarcinochrysis sp, Strain CCMP770" /LENGTH=330 /DNA_ID=CAMNT_0042957315 /DNA_START=6 /DNA_END=998 /DNA_ORIENTATION=+